MDRIYNKTSNVNDSNYVDLTNIPISKHLLVQGKSESLSDSSLEQTIKNKILSKLSEKVLKTILALGKRIYLEHSENIYRPDEAVRSVYFPETVVFSEFNTEADGKMIEISMIGSDGITGISSLFSDCPSQNLTQVLQPGYAFQINTGLLIRKLNDETEIKSLIFDYLNQFIKNISQKAVCNSFHLTEHRLCGWLLMLQERTGSSKLNLTHEQMALSLGTHRPSITQITKKMRREKLIDYQRGVIFILNRRGLEAAACSCYKPIF